MSKIACSVAQCVGEPVARGLCWKHYRRQQRHGNVDYVKRRYRMPHRCKYCGVTEAALFYKPYKSTCKRCKKVRAALRLAS